MSKDCPADPVDADLNVFEEPSPDGTFLETLKGETVAHVRSAPRDAGYMDPGYALANAHRLAACWNACRSAGLDTDVLEHVADTDGVGLEVTFTPETDGVEALQEQAVEEYRATLKERIEEEINRASGFSGRVSGLETAKELAMEAVDD